MLPLAGVVVLSVLASCSRGDDDAEVVPDANVFCGTAVEQQALIVDPPMGNEAELQASMDFYRVMGQLAPIAIAEDWNVLVAAMETASTVVPGDAESEQLVAMTAYATEPSAYRVKKWLRDNCGLDIPITTISPQEQVPAIEPTVPPSSTPDE